MSVLLASDLDRTLIHPWRTLPEPRDAALIAEVYDGRPITTCSPRTLRGIEQLVARGAFVAVTTRSRAQLERVAPVWERVRAGWAICANGATLLHDGAPDPEWMARSDAVCAAAATLAEAHEAFHAALGPADEAGWLLRVRSCDGRFLYAICDPDRLPEGLADAAQAAMAAFGWVAVLHGRKLYLLPAGLTKLACVEHLAVRLGVSRLLAAGDSLLDAELLAAADLAWCPADAELAAWGAVPAGVRVTTGRHLAAAEEILGEALAELAGSDNQRRREQHHGREHEQGPADLAGEAGRR